MKEIFTDLYKKVMGFFQSAPEQDSENAKDVARNRLKLVLMQDRTNLTPYLLERMRGEMVEVLSKYVEMDKDELELNFEQEGEGMALMLSIPVVRAKDEEEIQEILKSETEEETSDDETDLLEQYKALGTIDELKAILEKNTEKAEETEESEESEESEENSETEEEKSEEEESAEESEEKSEETEKEELTEEEKAEKQTVGLPNPHKVEEKTPIEYTELETVIEEFNAGEDEKEPENTQSKKNKK